MEKSLQDSAQVLAGAVRSRTLQKSTFEGVVETVLGRGSNQRHSATKLPGAEGSTGKTFKWLDAVGHHTLQGPGPREAPGSAGSCRVSSPAPALKTPLSAMQCVFSVL